MKNQWIIKPLPKEKVIDCLVHDVGLPNSLATILAQRGINSFETAKDYFRPNLDNLYDPYLMLDMDKAVQRVVLALDRKETILVYGDYDVDGTTSVAMVYDFLKSISPNVAYYIPDRYTEGYGISFQGIDFAEDNGFSLIIALDCGIKAVDKVEYATSKNIDFIICDHHLPGEKLPNAAAVLDAKIEGNDYPFKELSGCGVGFKLIQALAKELNIKDEVVFDYLDLLAVSIAADIVPIVDENRILAYYGIKKLMTSPSPGIKGLLGEFEKEKMTISDIVFNIAPKINATGRLEHASQSVDILVSKDIEKIKSISSQIHSLNLQRKETDGNVTVEAIEQIIKNQEEERFSTVVYDPNWHKGVLGIVASRLTETYYRPTLVLTNGMEGEITGSARSIKDFDVYEVIDSCSGLLSKYGGHKFAAGVTMPKENLDAFKDKFEAIVKEKIRPIQRKPSLEIDVQLDFKEINKKFLNILRQMEPFGPENMTPLFLTKNLIGGEIRKMGKNENHLRLSIIDENSGIRFSAVGFGLGKFEKDFQQQRFDIVYSIDENNWKGNTSIQLNIRDVRFRD